MPVAHDPALIVEWQIEGSEHRKRAGGERSRRIDRADFGVGKRAADECAVRHPRKIDIVYESRAAAQEARIFASQRMLPDRRRHAAIPSVPARMTLCMA